MGYVLATSRAWHEPMAARLQEKLGRTVTLINRKQDLKPQRLSSLDPRYVFFPHWSYIIPAEIYERYECVVFHMTDLPLGRGGSPLQNLIGRGIYETKLSALRCVAEVDSGPVYLKRPLSLHGNAEEIYLRAGRLTEEIILEIVNTNPHPQPQTGEVRTFSRRKPSESRIDRPQSLVKLFDHIRMLDAEGYPHAFVELDRFRYVFTRAAMKNGRIIADVEITEAADE